jgi:dCTP deaminase
MVINRQALLKLAPIVNMEVTKKTSHGTSYGLSEAGYDIRIKQTVQFRRNEHGVYINGIFKKGRFALSSSIEQFQMPTNLVGIVHDKSTWARRELSVYNTVIEPGWKGFLTLELIYNGEEDLIIPAGSGIAQVIFHETSCRSSYAGKYQNQEDNPVPARDS